jgi:hypothetical protein
VQIRNKGGASGALAPGAVHVGVQKFFGGRLGGAQFSSLPQEQKILVTADYKNVCIPP